jgi:hypothetical protein
VATNSNVQFDETTGNILNYAEIQTDYANRLAGMSKGSLEYSQLEEEYNNFKEYAKKYEETLN